MLQHLRDYEADLTSRGYSARTAGSYVLAVRQFHAWLGARPITAAALSEFRETLEEKAGSTRRMALAGLSTWFQYLGAHRLVETLPAVPSPTDPGADRRRRGNGGRRWEQAQ